MNIKSKVIRQKSGKSKGKWIIKIEYLDQLSGKTRFMERHTVKRGDAIDERNRLVEELRSSQGQCQTGERMTFADLTATAPSTFYKPAVVIDGRKIDGVRAHNAIPLKPRFRSVLVKLGALLNDSRATNFAGFASASAGIFVDLMPPMK